jgi:hypothetical protein
VAGGRAVAGETGAGVGVAEHFADQRLDFLGPTLVQPGLTLLAAELGELSVLEGHAAVLLLDVEVLLLDMAFQGTQTIEHLLIGLGLIGE